MTRLTRRIAIRVFVVASVVSGFPAARADRVVFGDSVRVHGFVQNQTGVFIAPDRSATEEYQAYPGAPRERFPSDHGDKLGRLSMLRNTLQIEADWAPRRWLALHATFRGVTGPPLAADRDAQPPHIPGDLAVPDQRRDWVAEHFYNEADLRELYLDLRPFELWSLRVGRQQVAWGEAGQYRLLDCVNPMDSTWHFGPLESFEDQRIPLWMVRSLVDVPPLAGALEVVWVPMVPVIERAGDTVTVPLIQVGAWGLPPTPRQGDVSVTTSKIRRRVFRYPDQTPANSRAGARWIGEIGNFSYSLVYFYGHQLSPPIPDRYIVGDWRGVDVELTFPRQHLAGFSLQTALPFPVSTLLRFEMLVEPDRTYPMYSELKKLEQEPTTADPRTIARFERKRKFTLDYAFTIQQPAVLRFLNPDDVVVFALQFFHSWIADFEPASVADCASVKGDCILEVPGYDSTLMRRHHFRLGGSLFTSYLNGTITPRVSGAWVFAADGWRKNFKDGGGFLSVGVDLAFGRHWRLGLAVNQFFGDDPYYGVGFFRDRDEVNLRVRYQF